MKKTNVVLVIAAHSDDETLGCGGTISKFVSEGYDVGVVFLTDGVGSRNDCEEEPVKIRERASISAVERLGAKIVRQFSFPDNELDSIPLIKIVKALEDVISSIKPSVIFTHFANDLNVDHRITNQAVMTACRPQSSCSVREIYAFEVLSSTEWASKVNLHFIPQLIIDVSEHWHKKLSALECYKDEMREFPHSRSFEAIDALGTLRGATHGVDKAEAFFVERIIST